MEGVTGDLSMQPSATLPTMGSIRSRKRPLKDTTKENPPVKKQQTSCPKKKSTAASKPSTRGSRRGNSSNTSKTKSNPSKPSIHPPSCSEIARLGLTSGEKASSRFYNESLQAVYKSCMLPTETAFAASHTTLSSAYSSTTEQRSLWKHTIHNPPNTTLQTTSSLSSQFSAHACTVVAAPGAKGLFGRKEPMKGRARAYSNIVLPTKQQWVEIKRIFTATTTAYNFANKRVRDDGAPVDLVQLKKDWARAEKDEYIQGVAMRFSNNAVGDLVKAYESNEEKKKLMAAKGKIHMYVVKDRTLDMPSQVVHIDRTKMLLEVVSVDTVPEIKHKKKKRRKSTNDDIEVENLKGTVPKTKHSEKRRLKTTSTRRAECGLRFGNNLESVGALRIQGKKKIIDRIMNTGADLAAAAKFRWDRVRQRLYFIWVDDAPGKPDPDRSFAHKSVVALDPGSAPFQQWYSPTSGQYGELLSGTGDYLKTRRLRIDKLRQRVNRRIHHPEKFITRRQRRFDRHKRNLKRQRTTRNLRRKLAREQQRLSGYVESAHYDAANFLLSRHDIVIAPILETGRLMCRNSRRFTGPSLSRSLYMWAHRLFRVRLAYAAHRYPGRYVFECCEPGTSKTCTNCGAWKDNLRLGDKVYSCSHCGVRVDRQLAGARNNFFAAYGMAMGIGWDGVHG